MANRKLNTFESLDSAVNYLLQRIELLEKDNQNLRTDLKKLNARFGLHLDFHAICDDNKDYED